MPLPSSSASAWRSTNRGRLAPADRGDKLGSRFESHAPSNRSWDSPKLLLPSAGVVASGGLPCGKPPPGRKAASTQSFVESRAAAGERSQIQQPNLCASCGQVSSSSSFFVHVPERPGFDPASEERIGVRRHSLFRPAGAFGRFGRGPRGARENVSQRGLTTGAVRFVGDCLPRPPRPAPDTSGLRSEGGGDGGG